MPLCRRAPSPAAMGSAPHHPGTMLGHVLPWHWGGRHSMRCDTGLTLLLCRAATLPVHSRIEQAVLCRQGTPLTSILALLKP